VVAPAAEQVQAGEAILLHNFRPIVTFRATFLGAPPVARARKSEQRIDQLTPAQMVQEISLTPFSFDGGRGITLTNNDNILFALVDGDLDPQEKLTLEQAAERRARRAQRCTAGGRHAASPRSPAQGSRLVCGGDGDRLCVALADQLVRRGCWSAVCNESSKRKMPVASCAGHGTAGCWCSEYRSC
jgi:hypothetical protein